MSETLHVPFSRQPIRVVLDIACGGGGGGLFRLRTSCHGRTYPRLFLQRKDVAFGWSIGFDGIPADRDSLHHLPSSRSAGSRTYFPSRL